MPAWCSPDGSGPDTQCYMSNEQARQFDPTTATQIEPIAVAPEQAAALLGLSRSMFYKQLEAGRIGPAGVRLGKCIRFPLAELRAWAAAGMPPRHKWERMKSEVQAADLA